MPTFTPYDYNQDTMVVINFKEQLQVGTFEHAVHHLIAHRLDLSIFHPRFKNDDTGRPAYDPAILLKIIQLSIPKASPPVARSNGVARPTSSSRHGIVAQHHNSTFIDVQSVSFFLPY